MPNDNLREPVSADNVNDVSVTALPETISAGGVICLRARPDDTTLYDYSWKVNGVAQGNANSSEISVDTTAMKLGCQKATVAVTAKAGTDTARAAPLRNTADVTFVVTPRMLSPTDVLYVRPSLQRTGIEPSTDQVLWPIIRNRARAISFVEYKKFIDAVMCSGGTAPDGTFMSVDRRLPFPFVDAYDLLKTATEAFLMQECGVAKLTAAQFTNLDEETSRLGRAVTADDIIRLRTAYLQEVTFGGKTSSALPYLKIIRDRLSDLPLKAPDEIVPNCYGILRTELSDPCLLELIWSYWHEEGMLVQTLNAISLRFQNRRSSADRDPLANFELDPLRPLNNLLWGYIQDEQHTLSVARRAYEYEHHYGLTLWGKAIKNLRPAERRSKFLEAFHNLLHEAAKFFKESDDTTVIPDGFPVLNSLKEVHLLLAQGAHNQYGDLPSTARAEMLIQEWLLARPEMRDFLGGRVMVPYTEAWMDRVDSMKTLQGWSDVTITHFRDLGVYGEQILLSVRYGDWVTINDQLSAGNWARYWRPEIQSYIHAYRAVTGVDLTLESPNAEEKAKWYALPSEHLRRRLPAVQRARP